MVNLRNSQQFIKDQSNFEEPYLREVLAGKKKHESGGFDDLKTIVVGKSSIFPSLHHRFNDKNSQLKSTEVTGDVKLNLRAASSKKVTLK